VSRVRDPSGPEAREHTLVAALRAQLEMPVSGLVHGVSGLIELVPSQASYVRCSIRASETNGDEPVRLTGSNFICVRLLVVSVTQTL
jgi:hypothetical protein